MPYKNIEKRREVQRLYREKNRNRINEKQREYAFRNKEKRAEISKKWNEENREKKRATAREYYQKNKDALKRKQKKYRRENPHIVANQHARRKANIGNSTLTKEDWLGVMNSTDWSCFYCKVKLTNQNRTIDHVIPLHFGGSHSANNIVPCCISCNSSKSSRLGTEWYYIRNMSDEQYEEWAKVAFKALGSC